MSQELVDKLKSTVDKLEARVEELENRLRGNSSGGNGGGNGGVSESIRMILMGPPGAGTFLPSASRFSFSAHRARANGKAAFNRQRHSGAVDQGEVFLLPSGHG